MQYQTVFHAKAGGPFAQILWLEAGTCSVLPRLQQACKTTDLFYFTSSVTMTINPIIKRIIVDPHSAGVPSNSLKLVSLLTFASFVGAVIYSKHVAPLAIEDRIRKEMFSTAPAAPSSGH